MAISRIATVLVWAAWLGGVPESRAQESAPSDALPQTLGESRALPQTLGESRALPGGARTTIELRTNPLLDLHYYMRKHMHDSRPDVPGFDAAAAAARALHEELGGNLGWGLLDGALAHCANVAEGLRLCEQLPAEFNSRSGRTLRLRGPASALLNAYEPLEAWHQRELWPRHEAAIRAAQATLERVLLPKLNDVYAATFAALDIRDPALTIPVVLVGQAPAPGAFTHRSRRTTAVCIVAADSLETCGPGAGTRADSDGGPAAAAPSAGLACETVLHETMHALDVARQADATVFNELRKRLTAAGVAADDRRLRDIPHTLMFVHAGEMVRRHIDPAHEHYGDRCGYYAKVPEVAPVVREVWLRRLDGQIDGGQAMNEIVARLTSP